MSQRDVAKNFNFSKDHKISLVLYFFMMISFYVAFLAELIWLRPMSWFIQLGVFIFALIYFKLYYQALKELYYSFWGLTVLYVAYAFYCFFNSLTYYHLSIPSYAYLASLLSLLIIAFLMSSPVYYPIFNWWEVDFRYRSDLKGVLEVVDQNYECRVSDIRRLAGCLVAFTELEMPTYGKLTVEIEQKKISLPVVLATKSEAIPGRGFSYGFKFIVLNKAEAQVYHHLMTHWRSEAKNKFAQKFKLIK